MSKKYSKNQSVPDWIRSIFEKKEAAYSSIELTHIYLSSSLNIIKVGESAKQDVEKRIAAEVAGIDLELGENKWYGLLKLISERKE